MENKILHTQSPELSGRIPYKIKFVNGNLFFKWIYIGTKKFSEPFFDETITSCLSLPENENMPFTSAATLLEIAGSVETINPSAFIFHVSRCGSTLLTQMLCIDENAIVLSEVPLLDELLRIPFSHPEKNFDAEKLFCATLAIIAQKRTGKEKYLFVKTDSWHLLFFERIRKLFPFTPALLLYRSPKEIIRSQQKLRGMHAVQGPLPPEIFGFANEQISEISPDEYLELVLEKYFHKILGILETDQHAEIISYHKGPMKMLENVIEFCDLKINAEIVSLMKKRTEQHSKYPENKFSEEKIEPGNLSVSLSEELFEKLNRAKNICQ